MVMGCKHLQTAETPSNLNTHLVAISCNKYKQWESENFIVSIITASILFCIYILSRTKTLRTYVCLKWTCPEQLLNWFNLGHMNGWFEPVCPVLFLLQGIFQLYAQVHTDGLFCTFIDIHVYNVKVSHRKFCTYLYRWSVSMCCCSYVLVYIQPYLIWWRKKMQHGHLCSTVMMYLSDGASE